jgi:hypothetical protein
LAEALDGLGKHEDAQVVARRAYTLAENMDDAKRAERLAALHEFFDQLNPDLLAA